ncbi:MAG: lipoate--protein ligase [Bacteroidales bacterium]|nr:lipoate--protein ligase [Bacteroidales bacterium]
MLCILNNSSTDPYFNLAAEEYVLKNFQENIFMLWQNDTSVICGKYQNAAAEINWDFIKERNIKVVRRLTGGGAVFHDLGNVNFTFIDQDGIGDFHSFTQPIINVLQQMGVPATFEGRNDLMIHGQKFSGNAQCYYQGKILHHGTLLFSSQMNDISAALKVNPLKFQDKAVKSVRKRVTNISEHLPQPMAISQFIHILMDYAQKNFPHATAYSFSPTDIQAIEKLRDEKYSTWKWNFGKSPKSDYHKMIHTAGGNIEVFISINQGMIDNFQLQGDFFAKKEIQPLEQQFIGQPYHENSIRQILQQTAVEDYFYQITQDDFIKLIF